MSGCAYDAANCPPEQATDSAGEGGASLGQENSVAQQAMSGRTYEIQPGDSLSGIAERATGSANNWQQLFEGELNSHIADPNLIKPGMILTLPPGWADPNGGPTTAATPETTTAPDAAESAGGEAPWWSSPLTSAGDLLDSAIETAGDVADSAADTLGDWWTTTTDAMGGLFGDEEEAGGGSAGASEPVETSAVGEAGTYIVNDAQALIRTEPPDLSSTGKSIPVGTRVEIAETATKGKSTYVKVQDEEREWGWTSKGNLASSKELDPALEPKDKISLEGLRGLDLKMAQIHNEKGGFLASKAAEMGISEAAAAAVLKVESGGKGFSVDGDMIIRFENHVFYDKWGKSNPKTFQDHFKYNSDKRWTGHQWRPGGSGDWQYFHGSQTSEWEVLEFARTLDDTAALYSISMGIGQIMGFNYKKEGYADVQEMFEDMNKSLTPQMAGMFEFIKNTPKCINGLRENDYVKFASGYNGSGKAEAYGVKIKDAADAYDRVKATLS